MQQHTFLAFVSARVKERKVGKDNKVLLLFQACYGKQVFLDAAKNGIAFTRN